jgi:alkaline phosphatase
MAGIPVSRGVTPDRTEALRAAIVGGRAASVILLVGDGMSDAEITLARDYQVGAAGRLALDTLPLSGSYTTYAVREDNPSLPDYVTDSAASATAWATGVKTSNGRLSTAPGTDRDLRTILEIAQAKGFRTGLVSTADLTDATPAAMASHVNNRDCQGPADMAECPKRRKSAGGKGSIAEQEVDRRVDVLLGGGKKRFEQILDGGPHAGKTVIQSARAQGYTLVTDAPGLRAARPGAKLLGLFASGNMSLEWGGEPALAYPGSGPQKCRQGLRPAQEPSLAEMTKKAIEWLGSGGVRARGFFLQVEGASIDKRGHAANPCEQIGETIAFDAAVRVSLDYAKSHPDTLVVVTGDHAHTCQIVSTQDADDHSPGALSTLVTSEGAMLTVNYATGLPGRTQHHTGTQVRIAAQGPQAANVAGVTDQTDLFHTLARALGAE